VSAPAADPLQVLVGLDPPTQLADHLLPALRTRGMAFDDAWEVAVENILWPSSKRETKDWELVLDATRESWRASYDREPPERSEWVLRGLAHVYAKLVPPVELAA
jgi:hypothetical protein